LITFATLRAIIGVRWSGQLRQVSLNSRSVRQGAIEKGEEEEKTVNQTALTEQLAALIEEVKQRSAKRQRERGTRAKQQRSARIEKAIRKSRRESRRLLVKKLKWLNETVRSGRYTG
jgi:hypothetical protein